MKNQIIQDVAVSNPCRISDTCKDAKSCYNAQKYFVLRNDWTTKWRAGKKVTFLAIENKTIWNSVQMMIQKQMHCWPEIEEALEI